MTSGIRKVGVIGMGLMGGGMWGVGFVVVDMRVRKLLKRFLATPMRRSDFLLALMFSRLAFSVAEALGAVKACNADASVSARWKSKGRMVRSPSFRSWPD